MPLSSLRRLSEPGAALAVVLGVPLDLDPEATAAEAEGAVVLPAARGRGHVLDDAHGAGLRQVDAAPRRRSA